MKKKKIILCQPEYYDMEYSISPWINTQNRVNKTAAFKQFQDLKDAFTEEGLDLIKSQFKNIIVANEADNNLLACNLVVNNNDVFIGKGISEELRNEIEGYGFKVTEIDMTEFLKGGGSVKCLTQEIFD